MRRCLQYRQWTLNFVTSMVVMAWIGQPLAAVAQPPQLERMGDRPKHFAMLRMWRLVDELEIDEDQAMRVFPAFRRQRVQQDSLEKQRRDLLAVVTRQLREEADDDALQASIRNVRTAEEAIELSQAAFDKELAKLLTTRQQARLLLFDATFRTDLVDIVRRMRGAGEGPGSEGMSGPGGGRGRLRGH